MTTSNCKGKEKPIFLAVSSRVPQKGRILVVDKIVEMYDPVSYWKWEVTEIGRVSYVKPISDSIFRVTTKDAIYIVQVFDWQKRK